MDFSFVIAEYNPFHLGHLYHLKETADGKPVVVIMSGPFVQRGEAAIGDKYLRALSAVKGGADIVLELPAPFAFSPAEKFAEGAFKSIKGVKGGKTLSFGSECGDIQTIKNTARLLSGDVLKVENAVKNYLEKGLSYPKAREAAIKDYASSSPLTFCDLSCPNDVLAIEYLKAANNMKMKFKAVKRKGSYSSLSAERSEDVYPSAAAIRELLDKGEVEEAKKCVPPSSYPVIEYATAHKPQQALLLDALGKDLKDIFDVTEGLENRFKKGVERAATFEEAFERIKTARYSNARLKRIALFALLDVTKEVYVDCVKAPPIYNVLAAKKSALPALDNFDGEIFFNHTNLKRSANPLAQLTAKAQEKYNVLLGGANWTAELVE